MQSWPISGMPITCLNLIKPDKMLHSSILELQLSCPQFNASHILMLYLDGIRIYECFKSHSFFEPTMVGFSLLIHYFIIRHLLIDYKTFLQWFGYVKMIRF